MSRIDPIEFGRACEQVIEGVGTRPEQNSDCTGTFRAAATHESINCHTCDKQISYYSDSPVHGPV